MGHQTHTDDDDELTDAGRTFGPFDRLTIRYVGRYSGGGPNYEIDGERHRWNTIDRETIRVTSLNVDGHTFAFGDTREGPTADAPGVVAEFGAADDGETCKTISTEARGTGVLARIDLDGGRSA